jgi:ubiquinone/menaquinone biosynthesis C-methylase UbiE
MSKQELNPGKILKMSGNYWETCTLHSGVKLDIFTVLGKENMTGEQLATKLKSDARGTIMLLNALAALDFLEKKDNKYTNTPLSTAFLVKDSPEYVGHIIMHHHHLVESWNRLDQAVMHGRPVRDKVSHSEKEQRESFLMGMFNLAMNLAPVVVPEIDLSGRHHLLDLGGGPGTYAIHFCMKYQDLKATVFDLPTTRPVAEKIIDRFNLTEIISFTEGDYTAENIKGKYDAAWMSHILHGESPEDCRKIIGKTVSALEPGGMILIHDFILKNSMDGPVFPALFSLNMLLGTSSGQSYSEQQIMDMLTEAGVKKLHRINFESINDSGIIAGFV